MYTRAANSHALSVSLAHFTTFSRSHADMLIYHAKLVRACQRFVMYETKGTPTMCLQNRCKNFEVGVPPPAHQLFWDLRDFIGWQRTALAFLTPNPHPMLAALLYWVVIDWASKETYSLIAVEWKSTLFGVIFEGITSFGVDSTPKL